MIQSKQDYEEFYQADLKATGIDGLPLRKSITARLQDRRFRFYKSLRKTEYYTNCKNHNLFEKIYGKYLRFRHYRLCDQYGWTVPINVFGKGLAIVHTGSIVVSGHARVGDFCRIHVGVNIGWATARGKDGAPTIGNCCYIGPGAKIFGPICIGDDVAIGANAVVNQSFGGGVTIAGVPARIISENTSEQYIIYRGDGR